MLRCLEVFLRAVPLAALAPWCWLCWQWGGERLMWRLILAALQAEGPIAIKFAQWASTRPDILPGRVCDNLSPLQANVKPHSFNQTKRILTKTFGPTWEGSLQLDSEPLGSGCMAQVYKGRLSGPLCRDQKAMPRSRDVAVKVLHPGAQDKVDLDLEVMWLLVGLIEAAWPKSRYLALSEAVTHFEAFVRPQADLRIEADNLDVFNENFPYRRTGRGHRVRFPEVVRPYVTKELLVESLEDGIPLQAVLGQAYRANRDCTVTPGAMLNVPVEELREEVGGLCMDVFLQMLFKDNFIHADLHPGNIHFQRRRVGTDSGHFLRSELVILDAGLAVQMSTQDRRNFTDVFYALTTNDGRRAAQLMVERTPGDRSLVRDEAGFVAEVGSLVSEVCGKGFALGKVRLGECFGQLLSLSCEHRVKLETSFVTVATSIIVLEGVGRQLSPIVDLAAAARPMLAEAIANRWSG